MASKSKKKGVVSKEDLKKLMKEKKNTGTINSPHAKYNTLGHLVCTVCNSQVKSDKLWNAHIMGRSHKENVIKSQKGQQLTKESVEALKRKFYDGEATSDHNSKKVKATPTEMKPIKGILKNSTGTSLISGYGEESSDEEEITPKATTQASATAGSGLPSDFFDSAPSSAAQEPEPPASSSEAADNLPEGFFDDPKLDAKARHVEYVNKDEQEWENFQKAMKEENEVSEKMAAEDDNEATEDRHLEEIDEQMSRWSRVDKICKQKDKLMEQKKPADSTDKAEESKDSSSDIDDDDDDMADFLDWRSKKVIK